MDDDFEAKKDKFLAKIEKIRTSAEQESLQKKALILNIKSQIVFSLMVRTLLFFVISVWLDTHWYIWVALLVLIVYFYELSQKLSLMSALINKDQDRRFVMECFKEAQDADEMSLAGWFQYFPAMKIANGFNQKISDETAVKEIKRMRKVFSTVRNEHEIT